MSKEHNTVATSWQGLLLAHSVTLYLNLTLQDVQWSHCLSAAIYSEFSHCEHVTITVLNGSFILTQERNKLRK